MIVQGTVIFHGNARGMPLFLTAPLSFYGGVDPHTGHIIQHGHPQHGQCIAGRILVLDASTGSTVGTWTILRMRKNRVAPAGIITHHCDPVLAAGSIIAKIPHIDGIPSSALGTSMTSIAGAEVISGASETAAPFHERENRTQDSGGIILKLGGSLITEKESLTPKIHERRLHNLAAALSQTTVPMVIVHGAGSFGHGPVQRMGLLNRTPGPDTSRGWSEVMSLQYALNNEVAHALRVAGLAPWPLQSELIAGPWASPLWGRQMLMETLTHGLVPLLYGSPELAPDGTFDILSGDTIVAACARLLGWKTIIHLTDVRGVYASPVDFTGDPIPFIYADEPPPNLTPGSSKPDVTGGMSGKLSPLLALALCGVTSHIVSGEEPDVIHRILSGEQVGTTITVTRHWRGKS
ncbi:DUF126 domain-containing protein [Myxococcota bacterium]|nr:DUF126 domain-containing protein [Myxococcota bacterium]